jgi:hypothetical protein
MDLKKQIKKVVIFVKFCALKIELKSWELQNVTLKILEFYESQVISVKY